MKKYIGLLLSIIMICSILDVYAENDDEAIMSVEVIPIQSDTSEFQEAIDSEGEFLDEQVEGEQPGTEPVEETEEVNEEIKKDENNEAEPNDINLLAGDVWSDAGSLTEGRADFDTIVINGDLYAVGGYGDSGYTYSIERYNASIAAWSIVTYIPDTINGFAVAGVDDKIYIIGGYKDNTFLNDIQIYDTTSNTWTTGTPMIERRDKAAAIYVDNKIYVFGGRNAKGIVSNYEYYDLSSNTWNKVTSGFDKSLIRLGAKGKYINGYVCIYGGLNQDYKSMGVDLYSASDMTNVTNILSKGKEYISIAWGNDKALILSSAENSSSYTVTEMVVEDNNAYSETSSLSAYPASWYTQNVMYKGYLYCIGGYNQTSKSYNTSTYRYSVYYGDFSTGDGTIDSETTGDGTTITFNAEVGKDYILMINVKNMTTFNGYTFTLEYPDNSFNVIDGCALSESRDWNSSQNNAEGTDIRITSVDSDRLSFISTEEIPSGKKVTETVNAVILRANSSGQRSITYRMTK
ncbi:MAG: hypothetical protein J1F01_06375 [Oscillospiraceae bacterium]|nr:hypothetical protein [Oscillospiraceae bacterium]